MFSGGMKNEWEHMEACDPPNRPLNNQTSTGDVFKLGSVYKVILKSVNSNHIRSWEDVLA